MVNGKSRCNADTTGWLSVSENLSSTFCWMRLLSDTWAWWRRRGSRSVSLTASSWLASQTSRHTNIYMYTHIHRAHVLPAPTASISTLKVKVEASYVKIKVRSIDWRCFHYCCDDCVCLSVRSHNHTAEFLFLCMHVAVGRSSSDGVEICYVRAVLWMSSCFHNHIGLMARCVYTCIAKRRESTTSITADIPTKFCSATENSQYSSWVPLGSEVCYLLQLSC